jgi:hypothetical protein
MLTKRLSSFAAIVAISSAASASYPPMLVGPAHKSFESCAAPQMYVDGWQTRGMGPHIVRCFIGYYN